MSRFASMIVAAALVAAAAIVASPATTPAHASSVCERGDGVWVIVDPGTLGGSATVACAPGDPSSGTAALTSAGFSWEFVKSFPGLVCRIAGKPGKDQETCEKAPPSDAHWAYWHAEAGGSWTYSRTGAAQRDPKPGEVEGWAFGTGKPPSVAPPAPPPEPEPEPEPEPSPPTSDGSGSSGGSSSTSGGSSSGSTPRSASSSTESGSSSGSNGSATGSGSSSQTSSAADVADQGADSGSTGDAEPAPAEDDDMSADDETTSHDPAPRSVDRLAHDLLGDDVEVHSSSFAAPDDPAEPPVETTGATPADEVAMDEAASTGRSAGVLAAGGLLVAIATAGAFVRRRRVEA